MTLYLTGPGGDSEVLVELEWKDFLVLEEYAGKEIGRIDKLDLIRFICDARMVVLR